MLVLQRVWRDEAGHDKLTQNIHQLVWERRLVKNILCLWQGRGGEHEENMDVNAIIWEIIKHSVLM